MLYCAFIAYPTCFEWLKIELILNDIWQSTNKRFKLLKEAVSRQIINYLNKVNLFQTISFSPNLIFDEKLLKKIISSAYFDLDKI